MDIKDPNLQADNLYTHHTKRSLVANTLREQRLLADQLRKFEAEKRTIAGEHRFLVKRIKKRSEALRKIQERIAENTTCRADKSISEGQTVNKQYGNITKYKSALPNIKSSTSAIHGEKRLQFPEEKAIRIFDNSYKNGKTKKQICAKTGHKYHEDINDRDADANNKVMKSKEENANNESEWQQLQNSGSKPKQASNVEERNGYLEPIQEMCEEKEKVDIVKIAVAKTKASRLQKQLKEDGALKLQKQVKEDVGAPKNRKASIFEETSTFMANLNNLSEMTDQKILEIIKDDTSNRKTITTALFPGELSPWRLGPILGSFCNDFHEPKTEFAKKREEIIAGQKIVDPVLKRMCKITICPPSISEGWTFKPSPRSWALDDALYPCHYHEQQLSPEVWNELQYCRYIRNNIEK